MPPHSHHDHHGGGHIPVSAFQDWGNWGWNPIYQPADYQVVQEPVPTWVWVAGGALAGMVLMLLSRGR
jgi:hypothetical protein